MNPYICVCGRFLCYLSYLHKSPPFPFPGKYSARLILYLLGSIVLTIVLRNFRQGFSVGINKISICLFSFAADDSQNLWPVKKKQCRSDRRVRVLLYPSITSVPTGNTPIILMKNLKESDQAASLPSPSIMLSALSRGIGILEYTR